jgi:hypothetical protein
MKLRIAVAVACLGLFGACIWIVPAQADQADRRAFSSARGPGAELRATRAAMRDANCSDFSNQAQAQSYYIAHGGPRSDPEGLDADHDGIACESLPCPCSSYTGPPPTTPSASPTETVTPSSTPTPTPSPTVTSSPTPQPPREMSMERAGRYYLQQICRTYGPDNRLWRAVFRGQQHVTVRDIDVAWLHQINSALASVSNVSYDSGRRLLNPPAKWPNRAASPVRAVANNYLATSDAAADARSSTAARFVRRWNANFYPKYSKATRLSRHARAVLNLPAPGKGC